MKARIGGSHGHLSNSAAAELVREFHHDDLCAVILAHLSEQANNSGLAREAFNSAAVGEVLAFATTADLPRASTLRLPVWGAFLPLCRVAK